MAESMLGRLRRRWGDLRSPLIAAPPIPPLVERRALIDLGSAWPWLSLGFIVWRHPGWTVDQIAELLAVFTPYIMLVGPTRPRAGGGSGAIAS